jgi:ribosomal protein S18 acetylase RimI-like enzyme
VTVLVRAATPADHAEIARLTVAAYRADGQIEGTGYDATLADVAGRAAAGELWVAQEEASGAVVGAVLTVEPGTRDAELSRPGELEFRMLAVDPPAQGRGVGAALVRHCLDLAARTGRSAVVICVRDLAVAAQHLYARHGFERVPELDWSPLPGVALLALRRAVNEGDPTPGPGLPAGKVSRPH